MKFQDAFNAAFDEEQLKQKPNVKFAIKKETFKTLAFFWNMVTLAEGKFDDIVFIDENTNIVSKPLKQVKKAVEQESESSEKVLLKKTNKKGRKKSSAKTAEKDVLDDDNNNFGNTAS